MRTRREETVDVQPQQLRKEVSYAYIALVKRSGGTATAPPT